MKHLATTPALLLFALCLHTTGCESKTESSVTIMVDGQDITKGFPKESAFGRVESCNKDKDAASCYAIGLMQYKGEGADKSLPQAIKWFTKGCDLDHMKSCDALIDIRTDQLLAAKEPDAKKAAIERYLPTAKKLCAYDKSVEGINRAHVCKNLGFIHYQGIGLEKPDYIQAIKYLNIACNLPTANKAESSREQACNTLGIMHYDGKGMSKSAVQAIKFYEKSCTFGGGASCKNLANIYFEGEAGVPADVPKGLSFAKKACHELKYIDACVRLADIHSKGLFGQPKNQEAYRKALGSACEAKGGTQCTDLAMSFYNGEKTPRSDWLKFHEYNQQGCNLQSGAGCRNLALFYERGVLDGHKNIPIAIPIYDKGCTLKDAGSCTNLALIYSKDPHQDPPKALAYYKKGCDFGNKFSCKKFKELQTPAP